MGLSRPARQFSLSTLLAFAAATCVSILILQKMVVLFDNLPREMVVLLIGSTFFFKSSPRYFFMRVCSLVSSVMPLMNNDLRFTCSDEDGCLSNV
jgi:hypothetical protein